MITTIKVMSGTSMRQIKYTMLIHPQDCTNSTFIFHSLFNLVKSKIQRNPHESLIELFCHFWLLFGGDSGIFTKQIVQFLDVTSRNQVSWVGFLEIRSLGCDL
jgi:hypothetical protein